MASNFNQYQHLDAFSFPAHLRGRPAWVVQLWLLVQSTLFALSPRFMYGWRRFLLRLFGAKVGNKVLIRPSVRVAYPWHLIFSEHAWIGDDVELYSIGNIRVGDHVVVSQRSYLCTATHDYTKRSFDTMVGDIEIGDGAWLATDVFVAPGVKIGRGCVIGARSSVFSDMPEGMICMGSPAKPVRSRNSGK
ncbi:MAG: colanic acid biosynthesis acetyltransferase WcaF [Gammaproteobacteria bacterium]|nr:MAG: colanic acid biosynthesis acetyltransferase WcaF [Gammaproteobacteria bacterium]